VEEFLVVKTVFFKVWGMESCFVIIHYTNNLIERKVTFSAALKISHLSQTFPLFKYYDTKILYLISSLWQMRKVAKS